MKFNEMSGRIVPVRWPLLLLLGLLVVGDKVLQGTYRVRLHIVHILCVLCVSLCTYPSLVYVHMYVLDECLRFGIPGSAAFNAILIIVILR